MTAGMASGNGGADLGSDAWRPSDAMVRLKRALIPGLQLGKPIAGLFAEVFR